MKREIKKIFGKFIIIVILAVIILCFMFISSSNNYDKIQYLENIDYDVTAYENGDMKVVETWDIRIVNTNTLFKTFKLSGGKYSGITDVQVTDITNGQYKPLTKINEEMYHVTKDCYYGLETSNNNYEIAWGIGMDNQSGRRQYQVSYIIKDAATDYFDCQELYWQFLAQGENTIPARKVTGTVTLPKDVQNIENLRVWGHGEIDGIINKVNGHEVNFEIDNLRAKSKLEIRIVTQEKLFNISAYNKIRRYNGLQNILEEETEWSNETNAKANTSRIIILIVYIAILVFYLIKILKARRFNNMKQKEKVEIEYYRDIPREKTATPAEAAYLYKFDKAKLSTESVQQDAVSATILDLCLKKKITLRTDSNSDVFVQIIDKPDGLKEDELEIYKMLKSVGGKEEFKIDKLKEYAHTQYANYSYIINNMVNSARNSLYRLKLIDKSKENSYQKYRHAEIKKVSLIIIYLSMILTQIISLIPFIRIRIDWAHGITFRSSITYFLIMLIPLVLELIWYFKVQVLVRNRIAVLTETGVEEKAQWKGLVNYMENFSKFKEKTVPDLILWEKYLVYATALGIADKVVKQMKASYPEVFVREYWEKENISNLYPILDFSMNPIYFSNNAHNPINTIEAGVDRAYTTTLSEIARHSSSSRKRRRWRLLKRRRWPVAAGRPEWEADKRRKNYL